MRDLRNHDVVRRASLASSFVRVAVSLLLLALLAPVATTSAQSPGQIQYFYDALGRLVEVVDQAGNAAIYTYDQVGNVLSIARITSAQVAIAALSPASGTVGTVVTITGTGFGTTNGSNAVAFNGTPATVTSESVTSIVVTVPAGATTGSVSVTAPLGTAVGPNPFVVTVAAPAPTITGISPHIVAHGDTVTVTGTGFDPTVSRDVLTMNQRVVPLTTATSTQLTFVVPARCHLWTSQISDGGWKCHERRRPVCHLAAVRRGQR